MGDLANGGVSPKNIRQEKKGLYILFNTAMTITLLDIIKLILILLEIPAIGYMAYVLWDTIKNAK